MVGLKNKRGGSSLDPPLCFVPLGYGLVSFPRFACGGGLAFQFRSPSNDFTCFDALDVKACVAVFKSVAEFEICCPTVPCCFHPFMWQCLTDGGVELPCESRICSLWFPRRRDRPTSTNRWRGYCVRAQARSVRYGSSCRYG